MPNKATIIALAWPDTKVVREGKWYDEPMKWVGAIKNNHYIAGHAAMLLIKHSSGEVHYFDYGRYHTPLKFGRVRDKETDPDVVAPISAEVKDGKIVNLKVLLFERYNNKACHGDGRLTAAIVNTIHFEKAYNKAKRMQNREAIPYGPFQFKGTTCSRFIAQVVCASTSNWLTKLLIRVPYTVSATPRSNNKVLSDCRCTFEINEGKLVHKKSDFYRFKKLLLPHHYLGEMPIDSSQLVSEYV